MKSIPELQRENADLRQRLEEAEEAIRALRSGEVDAVFVDAGEEQVYTLETANNPYRLLVEQMPQGAATLTSEGVIIYCNRRFASLLERPLHALLGKPLGDFVAAGNQSVLRDLLRDVHGSEASAELCLQPARGEAVLVYLSVRALNEGALGTCLLATDLTEMRQYEELQRAQKALRESKERLSTDLAAAQRLQEISTRLIQEDDVDQLYQQILEAAQDIMRSDMVCMQLVDESKETLRTLAFRGFDQTCVDVDLPNARVRSAERMIVPDIETFESIAGTPVFENYRKLGIRALQATPLVSRSGRLLGWISTHWRTPHVPDERDLRLLDVLARQAADLIERGQAEEALRSADRKKDEFLATLAHELRNPLAPIRNAVEILVVKGSEHPDLEWCRGVLDRQVRLMSRLLEDLLDVSRISRNTLELRREEVELADVIEIALETSRPVIEAAGHELEVRLPSEPIRLDADAIRLAQVFANLLNNAAKYTEAGGRIRLTVERQGNQVAVSVADSGIGIAAEALPRIFGIFSQATPALVRSQGGLGVGLALAKGLVELHGGSIEARSEGPGRGSEFIVHLPIGVEARREAARTTQDESPGAARYRILIVDDNRDSADSLSQLLKMMGNHVETAYDGAQAIDAARALRPEVVLLDLGMPKLNGYDVCRRLREEPWGREMVLIALTGWGQAEDRRRTEAAGFDRHIVKPADAGVLMNLLASTSPARATGSGR